MFVVSRLVELNGRIFIENIHHKTILEQSNWIFYYDSAIISAEQCQSNHCSKLSTSSEPVLRNVWTVGSRRYPKKLRFFVVRYEYLAMFNQITPWSRDFCCLSEPVTRLLRRLLPPCGLPPVLSSSSSLTHSLSLPLSFFYSNYSTILRFLYNFSIVSRC